MSKAGPPTYDEQRNHGCTTGVVGCWSDEVVSVGLDRVWGRAGAGRGFRCWHSRISEKKVAKSVHFSLENFAK